MNRFISPGLEIRRRLYLWKAGVCEPAVPRPYFVKVAVIVLCQQKCTHVLLNSLKRIAEVVSMLIRFALAKGQCAFRALLNIAQQNMSNRVAFTMKLIYFQGEYEN